MWEGRTYGCVKDGLPDDSDYPDQQKWSPKNGNCMHACWALLVLEDRVSMRFLLAIV